MKRIITISGICIILVAMNMVAWAAVEDVFTEKGMKPDKFRYCPACMMFKSKKGAMTEGMKKFMAEAGITDGMIARGRALMHAPLYMDSLSVLLGKAKALDLTDSQKDKLIGIEKQARKEAIAVLNQSQKSILGEIPEQPVTTREHMKEMHRKMRPVMHKRIKEGKDVYMGCPMMMKGIREPGVTKDELADAIEAYVKEESESHGGYFVVFDEKVGKKLKLTLDKVHRKRLSKVGRKRYFACADFKTPEGKIYDLDVFMKGTNKDNLTFFKFSIHKEAGKERYTWYEKGGIWKKKVVDEPVEEHPKEPEHPKKPSREHPSEHPQ